MKNKSITMTADQTLVYDEGSEIAQVNLMRDLREKAQEMLDDGASVVEIYTADGIVAAVVQ